jgi:PPOX class probable F420-dependent enzyme
MPSLDADGCRAFVTSAARTAQVATVRADGRPHVAPVWVDLDDEVAGSPQIVFMTGAETVKGRNLRRDPRVMLAWDDEEPPFTFVTVEGTAALSDDLTELKAWGARLGARYLGPERAAEMGERNGVPGELLVRVTVEKWHGFDQLSD